MGWDSMRNKELGELRGSDGVMSQDEYSLLLQAVHNDEDGGESIRGGKLLNEVHGDRVPWVSRDGKLLE